MSLRPFYSRALGIAARSLDKADQAVQPEASKVGEPKKTFLARAFGVGEALSCSNLENGGRYSMGGGADMDYLGHPLFRPSGRPFRVTGQEFGRN